MPLRRTGSYCGDRDVSIQDTFTVVSIVSTAVGVVSTSFFVIISLGRWRSALNEQIRRAQLETSELAWDLANKLHENSIASNALELIDGESSRVTTPQHGTHDVTDADLRQALTRHPDRPTASEKEAAIRHTFDAMFYALDRLRSAMHSELISDNDLSSATIYYCQKLATSHGFVLDYGMIAYPETVSFIKRLGSKPRVPSRQPRGAPEGHTSPE